MRTAQFSGKQGPSRVSYFFQQCSTRITGIPTETTKFILHPISSYAVSYHVQNIPLSFQHRPSPAAIKPTARHRIHVHNFSSHLSAAWRLKILSSVLSTPNKRDPLRRDRRAVRPLGARACKRHRGKLFCHLCCVPYSLNIAPFDRRARGSYGASISLQGSRWGGNRRRQNLELPGRRKRRQETVDMFSGHSSLCRAVGWTAAGEDRYWKERGTFWT